MIPERPLDLLCLGRAAVDLYSPEQGASLQQARTFVKNLGGCAANVAVGAARLGLRVGMLTRVGDDPFGRYVRETLREEGVDVEAVWDAPGRLTGLVTLAMEAPDRAPHLFFRERCADMAVDVDQVRATRPERAHILLLTGTHLGQPGPEAASWAALMRVRGAGGQVALDLDHRPSLWGEASVGRGEARAGVGSRAQGVIRRFLPHVDLVVGTEDEFRMAGGHPSTAESLAQVQAVTSARLVLKRGRAGAVSIGSDGTVTEHPGYPVPVKNLIGAGDGFLAAYLWAWKSGLQEMDKLRYGNAAGALVVSRHGCAPATPSQKELETFVQDLETRIPAARATDPTESNVAAAVAEAERQHALYLRGRTRGTRYTLAMDHRAFFEQAAAEAGRSRDVVYEVKRLVFEGGLAAFDAAPIDESESGFILDDEYSAPLIARAGRRAGLLARPIEANVQDELHFIGSPGAVLGTWPQRHVVKCKLVYHPDLPAELLERRRHAVADLAQVCRFQERAMLLEILPIDGAGREDLEAVPACLKDLGPIAHPLWWKVPPPSTEAQWAALGEYLDSGPAEAGILLLGNGLPREVVEHRIALATKQDRCRGFAFGRTVFAQACHAWLRNEIGDAELVQRVRDRLLHLIQVWSSGRHSAI